MSQNEKKLNELLLKNEALDRELENLIKQETLSKVAEYSSNPSNFSEEDWKALEKEREAFQLKLRRELDNISNIKEKERRQKERYIQPNWLFVK